MSYLKQIATVLLLLDGDIQLGFSVDDGLDWVDGFIDGIATPNNLLFLSKCADDIDHTGPAVGKIVTDIKNADWSAAIADGLAFIQDAEGDITSCKEIPSSTDGPRLKAWIT